ncbi:RcnB family protein [Terricaulis sp.]|uniref:RcnB family protein n=1 Tax=Terricaulis sp. TaxID=2768686 RepID=UPI002AC48E47|nr:RcnB family protein [Terricaulis sp.]MDZ4691803.1 RcnB family protein [Terricaulis sp.]
MKRLQTIALAALVMAGPLSVGAASAQSYRDREVRQERRDVREARGNLIQQRNELRQAQRWNQRQHNGYYLGTRFYYGQPSYAQMQRRDYRPAYQQWRRGDRLPSYAREHYREVDWRRERLRQPPSGYRYVRDDRGEVLLVGIATGVILGLILGNN